jgi:anaerobic selenocysteine-containing dehydrogenase
MGERKYRTCNLCEAMCGMVVTLEDGTITDIRGDHDDVLSHGHICPKGPAMRDLHEDPDRLRRPMRRTSAGFVPISWDEALAEAADRIAAVQARYGKNAVALYGGNPLAHNHGAALMGQALFVALGTKNRFDANSQDANPKLHASLLMFGNIVALTVPDIDRTDYFLVLGANPAASNGSVMSLGDVRGRLAGVRERGGRFVLIDPRRTETAAYADEHHFIRPGGDPALLLALLNVIFGEGLHDAASVDRVANGLSSLQALAARFPPSVSRQRSEWTRRPSGASRAALQVRSAPSPTAAWACARTSSARRVPGSSRRSTWSPATSTGRAAPCSQSPPSTSRASRGGSA